MKDRRTFLSLATSAAAFAGGLSRFPVAQAAPVSQGEIPLPQWQLLTAPTSPPARRDHSLTADPIDGRLYLFGGRRDNTTFDDLWVFDPSTTTWQGKPVTGARPPARFGHNAAVDVLRRRLIVTLGQLGNDFFDDIWAFDLAASEWTQLGGTSAERPAKRYGAGGALDVMSDRFLVTHGFTDRGRFDDTWAFDLETEAWQRIEVTGTVPEPRCLCHSAWDPSTNALLLYGGQSDRASFLGDMWAMDLTNGLWTALQPAAPGRRHFYAAASGEAFGRWYVFGGNTPAGPANDLWTYDAADDNWSRLEVAGAGARPSPRQSAGITFADGHLYLFGGRDGTANRADLWHLSP
jgi:hypothetical protein